MTMEWDSTRTEAPDADDAAPAGGPPAPPRDVTPVARRRAWADPHVRFWWASAVALVLAGLLLAGREVRDWRRQVWLAEHGTPVEAVVRQADIDTILTRKHAGDSYVALEFPWAGQSQTVTGRIGGRAPSELIAVNDKVTIRVDPNNPLAWTGWRTRPTLGYELVGGGIVAGAGLVLLLPALWQRGRVLRAWRDAPAVPATVVGVRQTPLAPRSRQVSCVNPSGDGRVFTVYVPARAAPVTRTGPNGAGERDALWVLFPRSGRPVAAAWFE